MNINLPALPSKILVGVSGGADSTFLLHYLIKQGIRDLVVCHLNHGLRGKAADEDALFVKELAEQYGLTFEGEKVLLGKLMQEKGVSSFEELAREARLRFFSKIGEQYGTRVVMLAHHADDQAETVLMNLCRGSAGLKGIEEERYLASYDLTILRPLLGVRKKEITAWLNENDFSWREDATNSEAVARRNRVRNEVLPLLGEIFQRDVTHNVLRGLQSDITPNLNEILEGLGVYDPQGRLYLPKLSAYSESLQSLILHTYLKDNGVNDLTQKKIEECLHLISDEGVSKINLPKGLHLRRKEKRIFIDSIA